MEGPAWNALICDQFSLHLIYDNLSPSSLQWFESHQIVGGGVLSHQYRCSTAHAAVDSDPRVMSTAVQASVSEFCDNLLIGYESQANAVDRPANDEFQTLTMSGPL